MFALGPAFFAAAGGTVPMQKEIFLTGASSAGTGYPVLLKVGESSGASGADFSIGNTAAFPSGKNVIGDLQFTDASANPLDVWVEQVTGSTPNRVAWIWVKVTADLDTNQSIFCTYNNGSGVVASNGANVFELFDDFDGSSLDAGKWQFTNGSGGLTIASSELTLVGNTTFRNIRSISTFADGKEVVGRVNPPTTTNSYVGGFGFWDACIFRNDFDTQGTSQWVIGPGTSLTELAARYQSQYYRMQVRRKSGASSLLIDGVSRASTASGTPTTAVTVPLMNVYTNLTTGKVDWIAVKKWQSTEPAFSSAGSEMPL
jgi:hypothetical protein